MSAAYETEVAPPAGSPEWLQMRKRGIGGSQAAAVLGLSRWKSAHEVYLEKRGLLDDPPPSRAMRLGTALEDVIRQEYMAETGKHVEKPECMFMSKPHPFMLANVDGLVTGEQRGLEVKRSDNPDVWGPSGSDTYPEDYYVQVQHYMVVLQVPLFDLCVLLPRNDMRIYTVEADAEVQQNIIDGEREFWIEHVEANVPPPLDFQHPNALKIVKRMFAGMEAEIELQPDADLLKALAAHKHACQILKELEAEKDAAAAYLAARVGNAKRARITGWGGAINRIAIAAGEVKYMREARTDLRINHPKESR